MFKKITLTLLLIFAIVSAIGCGDSPRENCRYEMELIYDNGAIDGVIDFFYVGDSADELVFYLFANADIGESSSEKSKIEIKDVLCGDNRLGYEISDDGVLLKVCFADGVKTKRNITIKFSTRLKNGNGRLGIAENCINVADFYPVLAVCSQGEYALRDYTDIGDCYFLDFSDYNINITIPSMYSLAVGGEICDCIVNGAQTTYKVKINNCRNAAFCLSEKYEVIVKKWGNRSINYYYLDDLNADETLNEAQKMLEWMSVNVGDYIFDSYTVAQSDYKGAQTAYTALSMIDRSLSGEYLKTAVAWQTAHQWFPLTAGCDEFTSGYLDEGLTAYLTYKYLCETDGSLAKKMYSDAQTAYKTYLKVQKALGGSIYDMDISLDNFNSVYDYENLWVNKSFLMFCEIEKWSGAKQMLSAIGKFYQNNLFVNADIEDFIKEFGLKQGGVRKILNCFVNSEAEIYLSN